MPVVPRSTGPGVGEIQAPSIRAPLEALGGGQAARPVDTSQTAGLVAQIVEQERRKQNEVALLDVGAKLAGGETALLHDPNEGVLTLKGRDAFGAIDHARERFQKLSNDIEGTLTNDDQKLAFRRMAQSRWAAIDEQVQSHMAAERASYDKQSYTSFVTNETNAAIASALTDPKRVEEAVDHQRAATIDYGRRNGWAPELIEQASTAAVSATRMGVLERLLNAGDDRTASEYFAAHKDQILPDDQGKVEKALHAASTLGAATRSVDAIIASKASPAEALAKAEAIEDPKVRQEAVQMVMGHFNNLDRVQRIEREGARARLLSDMEANKGRLNKGSLDWQLIDGHPEGEHVLERQRQILHPPPDPGDPDKYSMYVAKAVLSPATRQELLSTNIADIVKDPTLSGGQKTAIINLIRSERSKDVVDLRRQSEEAQREAKRLETVVKKARDDGDKETVANNEALMFAAQQHATILRGQLMTAQRESHFGSAPASTDATQPNTPASLAAPHSATSAASFGLSPVAAAKPLTPDMIRGLRQAGPLYDAYAAHLRSFGFSVPKVLPALPEDQETKKP